MSQHAAFETGAHLALDEPRGAAEELLFGLVAFTKTFTPEARAEEG